MDTKKLYPNGMLYWLIDVLQMVSLYYGRIPTAALYETFKNGKDIVPEAGTIGKEEFFDLVRFFLSIGDEPDIAGTEGAMAAGLTCRISGDELVALLGGEYMETLRKLKKNISQPHRVLTCEEVCQVIDKGYIRTPATDAFESYLKERWGMSDEKAKEMTRHTAIGFRTEDNLQAEISEIINTLCKERHIMEQSDLQKLLGLIMDMHNHTGKMRLCGWSPAEMSKLLYGSELPGVDLDKTGFPTGPLPEGVRIIPGSSYMAEKMKTGAEELKKRGVAFDTEASAGRYSAKTATPEGNIQNGRAVKVYPNDPCPCGSGKKYKYCHGL